MSASGPGLPSAPGAAPAMAPADVALGLLAAAVWGFTYVLTAAALERVPPILFTALRFAAAGALIVLVPRPAVSWRVILLAGTLLGAGQFSFLFTAMAYGVPPGTASVLVHTQALVMVALSALFFAERLHAKDVTALGLALAGLVVLALARDATNTYWGFALVLVAALCGGVGNLVLRRAGSGSSLRLAVWMSAVPPLPLLGLSLVLEGPSRLSQAIARSDWVVLGAVVYSALLATVMAYGIWGRLFRLYPATRTAPFLLLVPVVGLASSTALTGETLSPGKAIGAALVLAAVALAALPRSPVPPARPIEQ